MRVSQHPFRWPKARVRATVFCPLGLVAAGNAVHGRDMHPDPAGDGLAAVAIGQAGEDGTIAGGAAGGGDVDAQGAQFPAQAVGDGGGEAMGGAMIQPLGGGGGGGGGDDDRQDCVAIAVT